MRKVQEELGLLRDHGYLKREDYPYRSFVNAIVQVRLT